jgi:hypothetical protein
MSKELLMNLQMQKSQLQNGVSKLLSYNEQREMILKEKEDRLRQKYIKNDSARNLEANLNSSLPSYLAPGNVGDINRVIWPFYFTTQITDPIAPNTTVRTSINVTQEAAFTWMSYMKAVYLFNPGPDTLTYIDPDASNNASLAPGLGFTIRDAQSQREFFGGFVDLDTVGNPRFPSTLPSPMLVIPNGVLEVTFSNSHPTNYYLPRISFFGYRMRIENQQELLSTIYG